MKQEHSGGFTLVELIAVVAITGMLLASVSTANFFLERNKTVELSAIENNVQAAIIGYYGILGFYPGTAVGITVASDEFQLSLEQVVALSNELSKYSGFTFIPGVVLERYEFYLYYPNEYVFQIRTEPRGVGSGLIDVPTA